MSRRSGVPARPLSSSPPRRRSAGWTSTPTRASPSTCCVRTTAAATAFTCGARARTACPSCSWRRTTSLPAARKRSRKSWKKSSSPSDLCWGFQTQMTTHLKSTVQMWRRRSQRRTTPKWGSASSKLLGHLAEGE
ncbi:similar to B230212L03Rik protein, isoform CRA_a [Rattus norvegicus]|uniref:Maturin, neural progenitor differentiation regulator homolog n=2 Tax=Rattus norvegicus TaxID=10116 RepID=A0ABK0LK68_RAT|nr:similar to B230212L03Rik protein, isoform CRA_a [Rattus norvegicus]